MSRRGGTSIAAIGLASLSLLSFSLPMGLSWGQFDRRAEARRHYERALGLVDDGGYAEAVVEFRRAYELAPHHTVLYNLGLAYVALGKPVDAIDTLNRYLAEAGAAISPERRGQVEEEIRRQSTRVATLTLDANVAGAAIQVDGVVVGKSHLAAPIRVGIGIHRVTAELAGHQRAEQSITVAGEEQKVVNLVLVKLPPVEPLGPGLPSPPPTPARMETRRLVGYVSGALGLSAGAAAIGLYLWNRSRLERWDTTDLELERNQMADDFADRRRDNDALADSIRRWSTVTVWTGVAAGALLTTGIILLASSRRDARIVDRPRHGLKIGPGFAVFRTSW